ncbi:MAG TPA: MFS transporter [Isosphaeraceae bacterium]|jgi:MFS family permease
MMPTDNKGFRPGWAWGLCWLLFACTILNYMDRQAVAVVGERVANEFQIRFEELGWVIAAFQLSYALFQVPAGYLADRWNIRWTYAGAVVWWSLAAIGVASAPTLGLLMVFRALLGFGESFNWPCALRVTAQVLPPADRSLGNGIFNSGAAVGAVLTPLVVAPMTVWFGSWRVAFIVVGALGFVWVAMWLALTGGERKLLLATRSAQLGEPVGDWGGTEVRLPAVTKGAFGGLVALAVLGGFWGFFRVQDVVVAAETRDSNPAPGILERWRVKVGDRIRVGDELAEYRAAGALVPIKATAEGIIARFAVVPGDKVAAGQGILVLETRPYGLAAIWMAIAALMIGMLVVALLLPRRALAGSDWAESLGEVVRLRRFWVLVAVTISINVCWHFLVNWLPTYLKTDRGMLFVTGSLLSAIPFLAADVGNLGGGMLTQFLARRGMSPARARLLVLLGCVLLISCGAWVGKVQENSLTIVLLAVMALGTAAFMANYFAFCQEVSARHTGLIVGILGGLGNLFAAGFAPIAGRIKDTTGGFGPVFVIVGLLPLIGVGALVLGWGREEVASKPS